MKRTSLIALVAVIGITGGLAAVKALQVRAMIADGESFVPPPESITAVPVEAAEWETTLSTIGTVTAVHGVIIRSEVAGRIERLGFVSGAVAREGDVLLVLDRTQEIAVLHAAEARAELARANLARATELHAREVLPRSSLDSAEATFRETNAEVGVVRAAISKRVVRAPFSGRLGICQVHAGQVIDAGVAVVLLQTVDPVHVDFALPEQAAPSLAVGMPIRVTSDAAPGRTFQGTLTAIEPAVDAATRNLKLQATLEDTGGALLPGMFARVEAVLPGVRSVLVVPATVVRSAPYGDAVFVIRQATDERTGEEVSRVRMTTVHLGERRGDLIAIERGVAEGDLVASSGVFKLRNDAAVVIDAAAVQDRASQPTNS